MKSDNVVRERVSDIGGGSEPDQLDHVLDGFGLDVRVV